MNEVMNIRQAAAYLGTSQDSLYKHAMGGVLPAFKLGNRWRFKKSLLDEWMEKASREQQKVQKETCSANHRRPSLEGQTENRKANPEKKKAYCNTD